jgi:hypothetical protein
VELQRLKQQSERAEPVVYLGSSGDIDYIVDVRELGKSNSQIQQVNDPIY